VNTIKQLAAGAAFVLLFAVTGCAQKVVGESPADARKAATASATADAVAIMDATDKVAEDSRRAAQAQIEVGPADANAGKPPTVAEAKTAHSAALERCETQSADSRAQCKKHADLDLAAAKAHADAAIAATDPKA
jgi:hypothetical protein